MFSFPLSYKDNMPEVFKLKFMFNNIKIICQNYLSLNLCSIISAAGVYLTLK